MDNVSTIKAEKPVVPRHAIIGIVAVCLAAINSSLTSGLISAGLEDLRGAWHLGIDDAAYVPTAFNAAQMFMGPVSIMLAARFGHRSVLLVAGVIYIISNLLLPFTPHIVPILILLVIGGLASGTFYPLVLSFITRNLPLTMVTYGVAAYNLDLLGTNHLIQSLESFYMNHASWHWLFWNQCLFSIPLLLGVYFGIPRTPKDQLLPRFSYRGILYMSNALTLFYIAMDQGERLDWFNNGLINGLFIGAAIMFVAAIIRHIYAPNPFLDFKYLRNRNILILGLLLVSFRVTLLRTNLLLPQFLESLHQYRSGEIGNLDLLSVIPFLIAMPIVASLLNKVEARVIMLVGYVLLGVINFNDAHALSTWIATDFAPSQLWGVVGISLVSMGVMSGTVFEGRMTGAYRNRAGAYVQGAFFQVVRLFGGQTTTSAMRRFILVREHFWQTHLVSGTAYFSQFENRVEHLSTALTSQAASVGNAAGIALGLTAKNVQQQAFTFAIDDSFMMLAWVAVIGLIGVAMMQKTPLPKDLP
ncbi:MAG TPA: MFS transporter, partial [Trichormus sp.]